MACVATFGIIDEFDQNKNYGYYEPQKYNCVSISDEIINDWWADLLLVKTYFHCFECPGFALDRWGITIIPPESLPAFYNIVISHKRYNRKMLKKNIIRCKVYKKLCERKKKHDYKLQRKYAKYFLTRDLFFLAEKILTAIKRNKYMIHFGV